MKSAVGMGSQLHNNYSEAYKIFFIKPIILRVLSV